MPMDGLAGRDHAPARRDPGRRCSRARVNVPRRAHVDGRHLRRVQADHGRPPRLRDRRRGAATAKCEADIKAETQATIRNIPYGYEQAPGKPCIKCDKPATVSAWFAKALLSVVPKQAAGILLYRRARAGLEVLLAHPGGPLWARKDYGAWTSQRAVHRRRAAARCRQARIRRGNGLGADRRLPAARHPEAAKRQGDSRVGRGIGFRRRSVKSNLFSMEWPPKSGRMGGVSRSRSRGLVLDRRGARENT